MRSGWGGCSHLRFVFNARCVFFLHIEVGQLLQLFPYSAQDLGVALIPLLILGLQPLPSLQEDLGYLKRLSFSFNYLSIVYISNYPVGRLVGTLNESFKGHE